MRWTNSYLRIPALCAVFVLFPSLTRAALPGDDEKLKFAEQCEQRFDWEQACNVYEAILRQDRNQPEVRARYVQAVRRFWQVRRHRDISFRKEVLSLDYGQSVRLYNSLLETLLDNSLEAKNLALGVFLQKGVEELNLALADPNFCQIHVPNARPDEIREFRDYLVRTWGAASPQSRSQVQKQVREIALAAQGKLQLGASVTVMELASGSCYALDDYTAYLTPNQLKELCDSLKGEYVGVGIGVGVQDGKVVVAELAALSPAAEVMPPLLKDDQIVSVNRKSVAMLSADAVAELLEGPAGSPVDLEIYTPGAGIRYITLRRRSLFARSVDAHMKTEIVGYMRIACFQDTTLQEVDEALMNLRKNNVKVLVLDLRGNPGGLFDVAVEVARKFLENGIVVSLQKTQTSTIYQSRNPGALGVPMVILVDGDTASSAEVLAGALKDNKRGRLVGQATFGKGCTQSIFKLPNGPGGVPTGGLRITVARFFSPEGISYSGRGIVPHMLVERLLMPMNMNMMDHQLDEAILEAQRLLGS
jgi:carboxyl-terminal processing protease